MVVGGIEVPDYVLEVGIIDVIPVFLSVTLFFPAHQKVIGVGKNAFPHLGLNQLWACTFQTYVFLVRGHHRIQEAQIGFIDRHCT